MHRRNHSSISSFGRGGAKAVLAGRGPAAKPATDVPGPGSYGAPSQPGQRAAPAYSLGQSRIDTCKPSGPGPAAYDTAGTSASARPDTVGFGFGTASQRQLAAGETREEIDRASVNAPPDDGVTEARRRLQRMLAAELAKDERR